MNTKQICNNIENEYGEYVKEQKKAETHQWVKGG